MGRREACVCLNMSLTQEHNRLKSVVVSFETGTKNKTHLCNSNALKYNGNIKKEPPDVCCLRIGLGKWT